MDQIDLNIKSYSYNELLNLFKIDVNNINSHDILCQRLQSKVNNIRSKYSTDIYDFYNKGRVIVSTIYVWWYAAPRLLEANKPLSETQKNEVLADLESPAE